MTKIIKWDNNRSLSQISDYTRSNFAEYISISSNMRHSCIINGSTNAYWLVKLAYLNLGCDRAQSTNGLLTKWKRLFRKRYFIQSLCSTKPTLAPSLPKTLHKKLIVFELEHALKAISQIMHSLAKADRTYMTYLN